MADAQAFLVEIGTEELPPKSLRTLALAFLNQLSGLLVAQALQDAGSAAKNEVFFSPRRLTVYAPTVRRQQPDRTEHRLGPAVAAAFDRDGKATKAAEGFAKSCGVAVNQLQHLQTEKGERLACTVNLKGQAASELLPQLVNEALAKLPIARRMRWGTGEVEFVRPVHWVVLLFGTRAIRAPILGVTGGNKTYGHRYHHPAAITLAHPEDYRRALASTGKVLVEDRAGTLAKKIGSLVNQAAKRAGGRVVASAALVEEIAALVEWPVPVLGSFAAKFLALPDEVIEVVMETQQRYFALRDAEGKLLPKFVAVSNIRSKQPAEVRRGNERVITPRLSDAMFFWNKDRATPLAARLPELERVVFQKELGSYADKSRRVAQLAAQIATEIGSDPKLAERAGQLCKCDLVTGMVGEFPELQGIMGGHYARHDGEPDELACAIAEHYLPSHAGEQLPRTPTGQALAVADKLDTLTGIFAIGRKPTGDKDPFGLRRVGLGLMRIIIECRLNLDLVTLIQLSEAQHHLKGPQNGALLTDTLEFLLERLRAYYLETGLRADVFEAVKAKITGTEAPVYPLDFHARMQAVNAFLALPEAASLAAANKRISNILRQAGGEPQITIDPARFESENERQLNQAVQSAADSILPLLTNRDYTQALLQLAKLRKPVDSFFEKVMVMADDPGTRANRLALLARLRNLFMHTADLSLIQVE